MGRIYKSFSTTTDKATKNGNLYDMDVVVEDIKNLVKTKKGEYPGDVDKGCLIHEYLFHPELTQAERSTVIGDLRTQLQRDPRIIDVNIDVVSFKQGYYVLVNATIAPNNQELNLRIDLEQ